MVDAPAVRRQLLLASAVSLLFSAAYIWHQGSIEPAWMEGDSRQYVELGWNLLHGSYTRATEDVPAFPELTRAPGYPVFLAALYGLFGLRQDVVVVAQALLLVVLIWLIFAMAAPAFGQRAALASAWLAALLPVPHFRAAEVMSETLALLLLSLGLLFTLRVARRLSWQGCALAGLCFGLATLVRPAWVFLPAVMAAGLAIAQRGSGQQASRPLLSLAVIGLLVGGAWFARNYALVGTPGGNMRFGHNLFFASWQTYLRSGEFGIAYEVADDFVSDQAVVARLSPQQSEFVRQYQAIVEAHRYDPSAFPGVSEVDAKARLKVAQEAAFLRQGVANILADPVSYLVVRVTRGIPTLLAGTVPIRWEVIPDLPTWLLRLAIAPSLILVALAAVGFLATLTRVETQLLALAYAYGLLAHLPQLADGRFLEPIVAAPLALGGVGVVWLWDAWQRVFSRQRLFVQRAQ